MKNNISLRRLVLVACAILTTGVSEAQVGTIDFPTSASGDVQDNFIRGVAFLHSFAFEDAIEHFQKAQEAQPDFAMAYWGEAMSYNKNPLMDPTRQDLASARQALSRLAPTRAARIAKARTEREKAYLEAVEILYGQGEKLNRDLAYAEAMRQIVERYPEDGEARAFYALGLLGTVRRASEGYRIQMQAAAIAQELYRENPDHPGAAHYVIHAFDDTVHAPLALYAAERYSEIAPDAIHALHMPAHIVVQLGMWPQAANSNQRSYDASVTWAERKNLPDSERNFHALAWLQYAHLQLGHYEKAKECIDLIRPIAERENSSSLVKATLSNMRVRYLLETGLWQDIPLSNNVLEQERFAGDSIELLALGMRAAQAGDLATAGAVEKRLAVLQEQDAAGMKSYVQGQVTLEDLKRAVAISHKEVAAVLYLQKGADEEALRFAKQAISIRDEMHPSYGPPEPIKPPRELYAEILLELGRTEEAAMQFEDMLVRMPNRTQSILGAARAASKLGDKVTAAKQYNVLLSIWDETSMSAARDEAKSYLSKSEGS
jgi:hypothetical protein